MTTDEARLAQIQARLDAATPGNWIWWMSEEPPFDIDVRGKSVHPYIAAVERGADAEFIASAKGDIAFLLAQTAALRDQLARAEAVVAVVGEAARYVIADAPVSHDILGGRMCRYCEGHAIDAASIKHPTDCPVMVLGIALAARTPTPGAAGEVG